MLYEQWSLGTATAIANRRDGSLFVTLVKGLVIPATYEALHARMSRVSCRSRTLFIEDRVILAATSLSLVQAAARGTPTIQTGPAHAVVIIVSPRRLHWAMQHSVLMTSAGLSRAAMATGSAPAAASAL